MTEFNRIYYDLWEVFNNFSTKNIMIISREDFLKEIERVCIQNNQLKEQKQ